LQTNQRIDGYRIKLMCVTLGCAAIGGFAATRGLTPEQTFVSAIVVASLAAAITSKNASITRALGLIAVSVTVVVVAAAFDSMWPAVLSAVFAGLPFLITAPFVPDRHASLLSAAVAALAGASIGITSAYFVLFVACLCALVWKNAGRRPFATLQLAPYIAAFTLVGILLNMSILI
jgi:hypothetical protein